jgi:Holliday junction resolvase RusA-like endonuclease
MTQSDRWRKRPAVLRYFDFKDKLLGLVSGTLDSSFEVTFYMPMAKSWSPKKRAAMLGQPHQQKPDVDNLCKALMDCLCKEDSHIYRVTMSKYWAEEGSIDLLEPGSLTVDASGLID